MIPKKTPSATSDNPIIHGLISVPKKEALLLLEAGYFLMQLGQYEEAKDIFVGVAALFPHSDVPCIALGNLYLAQGKAALAVKEHKRALTRAPNSITAQVHLGEALLFQKKNQQAMHVLKKAIEKDPESLAARFARELLHANDLHVFD